MRRTPYADLEATSALANEPLKLRCRPGATAQKPHRKPRRLQGLWVSLLTALVQSLSVIFPAILSWRVIPAVLTVACFLYVVPFDVLYIAKATTLLLLALVEGCFWVWLQRARRRMSSIPPVSERLPAPTSELDVFNRTMETVTTCGAWNISKGISRSPTAWLETWFLNTPIAQIQHDNMVEFYAWAFFTKDPEELRGVDRTLVESMIRESEDRFGWNFPAGNNASVRCIRTNMDALKAFYHPFVYYAGVALLSAATYQTMRLIGFAHHTGAQGISYFHCDPPATPGTLIVGGVPVQRPRLPPIVLLHGLGVGIAPYLRLIRRLACNRECFVVLLPEVIPSAMAERTPRPEEMTSAVGAMLSAHGHRSACFVAHSYGTVVLSWILRGQKDIVAKAVFLDPVCFLLCQPDVAYKVLYRRPPNLFMTAAANLCFWELYTANALMHHFYWQHNTLWKDEIPAGSVVAIAGRDDVSDPKAVRQYLEDHQRHGANGAKDPEAQLKIVWLDGFLHAQILVSRAAQLQILDLI